MAALKLRQCYDNQILALPLNRGSRASYTRYALAGCNQLARPQLKVVPCSLKQRVLATDDVQLVEFLGRISEFHAFATPIFRSRYKAFGAALGVACACLQGGAKTFWISDAPMIGSRQTRISLRSFLLELLMPTLDKFVSVFSRAVSLEINLVSLFLGVLDQKPLDAL